MASRERKTVMEGLEWIERMNRMNERTALLYENDNEVDNRDREYTPCPEEQVCIFLIYLVCVAVIVFSNANLVHQYLYA
jgi:hypothetical protein